MKKKRQYTVTEKVLQARLNMVKYSRNMAILNLLKEGKNVSEVCKIYKLTHQRIYQIRKAMNNYINLPIANTK
jgi:Mor family transcriptional regulator